MNSLLFENGKYKSDNSRVTWLGRLLPSLTYYSKMAAIVLRSSLQAQRGVYTVQKWQESSCEIIRGLESVGVDFNIIGEDSIAAVSGPCVFIGNHMSTLETFSLPAIILPHINTTFIIKKSLVEYPVFKHIMKSSNPIVVERTNAREDLKIVMEEGIKRLKEGFSVIVFPQTTRTFEFDHSKFNTIGIKLAKRADVPVIPLALKTNAWGNGKLIKDFGKIDPTKKVHFAFGKSIRISGNGKEEHAAVISFIEKHLEEWQQ